MRAFSRALQSGTDPALRKLLRAVLATVVRKPQSLTWACWYTTTAAHKRSIHRRSIPGFDTDAVRAFAFNMHHGAHQLARERFSYKLQDVLGLLEKQQDAARREPEADTRRIAAGDAILAELKSRHDWIMNPTDSALTNLVSSFGFTYYLGATPAAALVNLTQTALVSYPFLAARHGPIKAMNYMLAASRDAVRTMGNIQRTLTDPDELRAYQALQVSGAIDKTQAHNLAGIAEGGMAGYNPAWSKAMEIIGWGFHKTEVVNREATGMAAFRLARDGGAGFDEAVRSARDAIFDTHFDYSNANRARFMQSGTAKVLLMFRQYSLNMTWALGRMVWQSTKGQDPEVRRIARRNLAGVLGMSSLFSGVLGLPMMSMAMGTLNALQAAFGDDDEPWDAETEFRAFLSEAVGPSGAELLLRGPANKLTGANIAGRVGLDSLWIRDADRELEGRGLFNHLLEQAAGPMGGVLKNVLVGTQQIGEGHTMRGVETMLPKGMKDVIKAGRYATQGVNTLRGDPVLEDVSLWQVLLQGSGFSPAQIAERYERNRALKNYEEHITGRRQSLMNAYAMAIRNGDAGDRAAVMEKILAFNKTNPEVAISSSSIRASMKSRARYSANAEGGIVLNPKLAARMRERVGLAE
ncbi:PLxRFG domain-containing protein [Stenotrophomonas sp. SY1]|nr:PLxRFG domain-containing protein [Stenotrophomonas sp. SY1]